VLFRTEQIGIHQVLQADFGEHLAPRRHRLGLQGLRVGLGKDLGGDQPLEEILELYPVDDRQLPVAVQREVELPVVAAVFEAVGVVTDSVLDSPHFETGTVERLGEEELLPQRDDVLLLVE
jgi:hypothetical protein